METEYSTVTPVAPLSVSVTGTGIAQAVWSYTSRTLADTQSVVNAIQSNNPSLLSEPSDLPYVPVRYYAGQVSATRMAAFLDNPVVNYGMDRPVAAATATAPYGLWSTNFVTQVSNNQGTIVSPYGAAGGGGGSGSGGGGGVIMFGDEVTAGAVGGTGSYNPGNAGGGRGGDGITLVFYCPGGLNGTKSLDPAAGPGGLSASGPSGLAGQTGVYLAISVIVPGSPPPVPTATITPVPASVAVVPPTMPVSANRMTAPRSCDAISCACLRFSSLFWCSYYELSELSERVEKLNNQVVSLRERVARLEEDNWWLKRELEKVNRRRRRITDIIIRIVLELLNILSRHSLAH